MAGRSGFVDVTLVMVTLMLTARGAHLTDRHFARRLLRGALDATRRQQIHFIRRRHQQALLLQQIIFVGVVSVAATALFRRQRARRGLLGMVDRRQDASAAR